MIGSIRSLAFAAHSPIASAFQSKFQSNFIERPQNFVLWVVLSLLRK